MFLKRSYKKSGNNTYVHLQIVEAYYDNGRSRQKVIKSLGREDSINVEYVNSLIDTLNNGNVDSLSENEMSLLPTKSYGPLLILNKAFQDLNFHRYFYDLNIVKRGDINLQGAVFFLLAYSILNENEDLPFEEWLHEQYLFDYASPTKSTLNKTFDVLKEHNLINDAVSSMLEDDLISNQKLRFICPLRMSCKGREEVQLLTGLETDSYFTPLALCDSKQIPIYSEDSILVSDTKFVNYHFIKENKSKKFILKIRPSELPLLLKDELPNTEPFEKDGYFSPWVNGGYLQIDLGDKTLFIIRPESGLAPILANRFKEPREIFLTNCTESWEQISETILQFEIYSEHLYHLVYPPEEFANEFENYKDTLLNVAFIKILLFRYIKRKIGIGTPIEKVLDAMRPLRVTTLDYRNFLYHTKLTNEQKNIMTAMGYRRHPHPKRALK